MKGKPHWNTRMIAVHTTDEPRAHRAAEPRRVRGYTILELMLAIGIVGVIAGFAVPSFLSTVRINRTVSANNDLVSAMALARSEAIKRGSRVTVCPSPDQLSCNNSGLWEQGWIVFVDPANPGVADVGEEFLRVWLPLEGGTTIRAGGAFANFVSFIASGETRGGAGNTDSFSVCDQRAVAADGRTITVGLIGYAKTAKGALACP